MYCICLHKESGEMSVMSRSEREAMISVLLDLKQSIDTWVIGLKASKEEAEQYIQAIKETNELINQVLK